MSEHVTHLFCTVGNMKVKSPAKVKEILWEALEIEPAKRREFLDNAGTTAEIRGEIESLLSFEAVSADFMSLAITDFSKDFPLEVEETEISLVGQEVGLDGQVADRPGTPLLDRPEDLFQPRADVKEAGPQGAEQGLVTGESYQIKLHGTYINRDDAYCLRRIHQE